MNGDKRTMTNKELEQASQEFWEEVSRLAEKYEVTADYILREFYVNINP